MRIGQGPGGAHNIGGPQPPNASVGDAASKGDLPSVQARVEARGLPGVVAAGREVKDAVQNDFLTSGARRSMGVGASGREFTANKSGEPFGMAVPLGKGVTTADLSSRKFAPMPTLRGEHSFAPGGDAVGISTGLSPTRASEGFAFRGRVLPSALGG